VAVISALLVSVTCHLFVSSLTAVLDALNAPESVLSSPDDDSEDENSEDEDGRYITAIGSVTFVERTICQVISAAFSSFVFLCTAVWKPLLSIS